MRILPVNNCQQYYSQQSICNSINCNFKSLNKAKKIIDKTKPVVTQKATKLELPPVLLETEKILKKFNITNCNSKDHIININSGYNGGFYSIRTYGDYSNTDAKMFLASHLINENTNPFGGLIKYIAMVNDIKRQDIIEKGLKIHSFELNNDVTPEQKKTAKCYLSKYIGSNISENDLFFIENEAYYYNKNSKTGYGISFLLDKHKKVEPLVRKCQFKLDKNGNAIGYSIKDYNAYYKQTVEKDYIEQAKPSVTLKAIAENDNNKEYAEAFRFGNSDIHQKVKNGIPKVLEKLANKLALPNITRYDLQIVKFYDKNNQVQSRICYYDPSIGKSFVFDADGIFKYQLEYNRDSNGDIISCTIF